MKVSLFDVARFAGRGTCCLTGLLFRLMAFCTQLVHYLFLFEFSLCFIVIDGPQRLRESIVTDITVFEIVLVSSMRKGNLSFGAAVKRDILSPHILFFSSASSRKHHSKNNQQYD
jgi:hypothetical protein